MGNTFSRIVISTMLLIAMGVAVEDSDSENTESRMNNIKYDESEDNTVSDRPGAEDHAEQSSFDEAIREQIASSEKVKPEQLRMLSESTWVDTTFDEKCSGHGAGPIPNCKPSNPCNTFWIALGRTAVASGIHSWRTCLEDLLGPGKRDAKTPVKIQGLFEPYIMTQESPEGNVKWVRPISNTVWQKQIHGIRRSKHAKGNANEKRFETTYTDYNGYARLMRPGEWATYTKLTSTFHPIKITATLRTTGWLMTYDQLNPWAEPAPPPYNARFQVIKGDSWPEELTAEGIAVIKRSKAFAEGRSGFVWTGKDHGLDRKVLRGILEIDEDVFKKTWLERIRTRTGPLC